MQIVFLGGDAAVGDAAGEKGLEDRVGDGVKHCWGGAMRSGEGGRVGWWWVCEWVVRRRSQEAEEGRKVFLEESKGK